MKSTRRSTSKPRKSTRTSAKKKSSKRKPIMRHSKEG